jgi:hypothetical protein
VVRRRCTLSPFPIRRVNAGKSSRETSDNRRESWNDGFAKCRTVHSKSKKRLSFQAHLVRQRTSYVLRSRLLTILSLAAWRSSLPAHVPGSSRFPGRAFATPLLSKIRATGTSDISPDDGCTNPAEINRFQPLQKGRGPTMQNPLILSRNCKKTRGFVKYTPLGSNQQPSVP